MNIPAATLAPSQSPSLPRGLVWLLRAEAAAVLVVAITAYVATVHRWTMFALLFFLPDVSMVGYLAGKRQGALCYNVAHSYLAPLILLGAVLATAAGLESLPAALAYIWLAHVGFDRALGYGLKQRSGFTTTHLGEIGRSAPPRSAA